MAGIAITDPGKGARIKGPSHVFFNVAVPDPGEAMTLTATAAGDFKTPDATENPNAFYAGCIVDVKGNLTQEVGVERCDNTQAPIDILAGFSEGTFELMLKSFINDDVMESLLGATATDLTGKTLYEFGSHENFPEMAIAIVGKMADDPTKYWYSMLYRVFITSLYKLEPIKLNEYARLQIQGRVAGYPGRLAGIAIGQHMGGI